MLSIFAISDTVCQQRQLEQIRGLQTDNCKLHLSLQIY